MIFIINLKSVMSVNLEVLYYIISYTRCYEYSLGLDTTLISAYSHLNIVSENWLIKLSTEPGEVANIFGCT